MSPPSLFTVRRFWPLFWTQFFGAFNDNFLKIALTVAITYQGVEVFGVPPAQMNALAGGLFILPFFLFSATAGQLADRTEKTRIIYWVKLTEILIMGIAGAGFLLHLYELVLAAIFLMGTHSTFFGPIKYSILPQHLGKDELVQGNAYVEAGTFLAILLGLICGGLLVEHGPVFVSSALLVLALSGFAISRKIPLAPPAQPDLEVEWNVVKPTFRILREVAKNQTVFEAIQGISWFWFFGSIVLALLPILCKENIQGSAGLLTFFLTLFSVGIGVGSILTERASKHGLEVGLIALGSIGMSVFCAGIGLIDPPVIPGAGFLELLQNPRGLGLSVCLFMMSVSGGFFTVPLYTLMQEKSNPALRSRTIAGNNILNALYMVIGAVALMVLFSLHLSPKKIFLILAFLNFAAGLYRYARNPEYHFRLLTMFLTRVTYRLRVVGMEHIPRDGAAFLVANHVSFVDWLIVMGALKRPVRFVMDHNFEKGFLMKRTVHRARIITIAPARESVGKLKAGFTKVSQALKEGDLVMIFPEGVITRDGKLSSFRQGIEKMLAEDPVPVIPMAIQGMWGSIFSRKGGPALKKPPRRFRARITLRIGAPVPPEGVTAAVLQARVQELLDTK